MTLNELASLESLCGLLAPAELRRVADSLIIDGTPRRAVQGLALDKRDLAHELIRSVIEGFGNRHAVAAALKAVAAATERVPPPPTLVWSGPHLPGDSTRTTSAVVRLIDEAEDSILASTYSGTATAPFVQALARAAQRKLSITVIADISQRRTTAEAIKGAVPRARVLGFYNNDTGLPGLQHAKVLVIDGRTALVTSANLSYAAIERNLEAGVLMHDAAVASLISRRFADLIAAGNLRELK